MRIKNKQQDDIFKPNLLVIILNANCPNIPIQRPKTDRLDKKKDQTTCYLQDIHLKYKDRDMLEKME